MSEKKTVAILLGMFLLVCGGIEFLLLGMSANPELGSRFLKLTGLILGLYVLFVVGLFKSGPNRDKKRARLLSRTLPTLGVIAVGLFFGDIKDSIGYLILRENIIQKYKVALAKADTEPAEAFLSCKAALQYITADCSKTLKSVTDPRLCRKLCKSCNSDEQTFSQYECAKIMVEKMDPKAPFDICKEAGLTDWFYNECLKASVLVRVGVEKPLGGQEAEVYKYRSLGELLNIKTKE